MHPTYQSDIRFAILSNLPSGSELLMFSIIFAPPFRDHFAPLRQREKQPGASGVLPRGGGSNPMHRDTFAWQSGTKRSRNGGNKSDKKRPAATRRAVILNAVSIGIKSPPFPSTPSFTIIMYYRIIVCMFFQTTRGTARCIDSRGFCAMENARWRRGGFMRGTRRPRGHALINAIYLDTWNQCK